MFPRLPQGYVYEFEVTTHLTSVNTLSKQVGPRLSIRLTRPTPSRTEHLRMYNSAEGGRRLPLEEPIPYTVIYTPKGYHFDNLQKLSDWLGANEGTE